MRKTLPSALLVMGFLFAFSADAQAGPRCFFKKLRCSPPRGCVQESAVKAELPFVILARAGGNETRFATLADAVQAARDKDIIEIRGNGPYYASNIVIKGKELTVRGGKGFDPVIRPHPEHARDPRTVLFILNDAVIHIHDFTLDGVGLRF